MKIGLLRHFKVKLKYPKKPLLKYEEVFDWYEKYNAAEVAVMDSGIKTEDWDKCYASPLYRAEVTSKSVYKGDIITDERLKELDVLPVLKGTSRKPFLVWGLMLKIKSTQKNQITEKFEASVSEFLEEILRTNRGSTLLVCHGFVMTFIQKELKKKGFTGDSFFIPDYNKVYIYEKK